MTSLHAAMLASVATAAMVMPAHAQVTPPVQETPTPQEDVVNAEDVVVTGIRETLRTSADVKRRETAIVDALSSDDIGDLPALSVGQAIQTITGATTHREKGDASEIALRGLGPFLSNATFNGRDATNGSGDRAVNFNQFPSELINGIKIYKTQQANLVEGGVAGTIELSTLRPLDFNKQRLQAEYKVNFNPYGDRIVGRDGLGSRFTVSYVDQFKAGSLGDIGVSIGYQFNKTNNPEETLAGSSTWTACDNRVTIAANNCTEITRQQGTSGVPYYYAPNSFAFRQIVENDERNSVFGAIQWQPGADFEVNVDVQYSKRIFDEDRHDLNISEGRYGLRDRIVDADGRLLFANGLSSVESTSSLLTRDERYLGGGVNLAWKLSDRLRIAADASYSSTDRTETERNSRLRTDPLDIFGVRTPINNQRIPYTFDARGSFAPVFTFDPRFDVTNHALFSDDTRLRRDEVQRDNEIWAGRVDATYTMDGFLSQIDVGGRYTYLTYADYDNRNEIEINNTATERAANLACRTQFPQTNYLSDAPGSPITRWATFDSLCLFQAHLDTEDPGLTADLRNPGNRDVEERTWAGYVMGSYQGDLGDMPVRGNFGVRVVNTQVTSRGLRSPLTVTPTTDGGIRLTPTGEFETVTIESEVTRWLPSVNAIFEVAPNTLVRAAAYRALSRPAPSSLGAGRTVNLETGTTFTTIDDAIRNITANGSPRLEPLMSWNGDIAFEWYPNRDTLFATTLYYKQFTGGFQPVVFDESFTIGGQNLTIPVVQTRNSPDKSRIWGVEVTAQHTFTWLPAPFDGLGAKISYNYADSDFETQDIRYGDVFDPETGVVTPGFTPPANISGYSKHVASAQAYYEKGPFSGQAIFNYRSNYFQDFVGGNTQLRYVEDNGTLDLRATMQLGKNVALRLEALNVFNEPKVTYMPIQGVTRQYHYYGSKYFLGLRVRL